MILKDLKVHETLVLKLGLDGGCVVQGSDICWHIAMDAADSGGPQASEPCPVTITYPTSVLISLSNRLDSDLTWLADWTGMNSGAWTAEKTCF